MKIHPYVSFNGKCAEAIELYEKAFNVKAQIMRYSDAPPSEEYPISKDTENLVMHACLTNRSDYTVFMADVPPDMPTKFGTGVAISIELDNKESVDAAFNVLKEGGTVSMELQKTFWSAYFGSLTDKFGVEWLLSIAENN